MAIQTIAISMTVSKTISMAIHQVGISLSLSLPLANGMNISRVDSEGRDLDLVLIDNGFPSSVGDHSTGANSQRSLAGLIDLGVESRGAEESRNLMDSSLQLSIVSSNRLVASNSNRDWEVGGNNIGLNSRGDGLVGHLLGGWDHSRDMGIGEASIRETSIGVARVPKSSNKNLSISIPLAIIMVSMSISISKTVQTIAISQTRISTIQNIGISLSLSLPLANGMISRVDSEGRDLDLVLIDNGFPSSVGDHSTGANSQRSLAGLIDLAVEGRGTEESRNLMDSTLQLSIVSSNGLVASNSNRDREVGGHNIGLNGGGDGLVGHLLGCWDHSRDMGIWEPGIGKACIWKTSIGVAKASDQNLRVSMGHCQQEG